ncbi:metalloregulator ArsR/SmtB family transcription factor [Actinoplanes sp. NPDC051346]|uniref:ArsR/SmtB family transcription factor n=1 Tax=Actinoplanes sp. NPDC051346 TaxID=3155048 RepID=UPI0034398F33
MARAATTTDAFNAVAEPRRRQILDLLAAGERPVNDLAELLGLAQPQVSKHLRVLREVDLVHVRDEGRQRMYRINAAPLKSIHDWLRKYEQAWNTRFDLMDDVLDELKESELKETELKESELKESELKDGELKEAEAHDDEH